LIAVFWGMAKRKKDIQKRNRRKRQQQKDI
jgi:hypothetical protein